MYDVLNNNVVSGRKPPITQISWSRHYLTLSISETVGDTDTVTVK